MRIDGALRLTEARRKQPGIKWPIPIDARLDDLVDLANDSGAATGRGELAAALILEREANADGLRDAVLEFRTALVRDALVSDRAGVYKLRKRGRPSKSKARRR